MALWGLGTDIVEIARVEAIVARTGDRLAKRILAPGEWARYQQVQQKGRYLAKRFAVKEAAAKAFGTGFCHGLAFAHFEVEHDLLGKPLLRLHGQAADMAKERGIQTIHVTLADERQYVCATVIFE